MAYEIKRYANRKLYDPQASRYVTLEEVEAMIRAGKDIAVRDVSTGEDLTSVVLAQILLEKERHRRPVLPAAFLRQLIQYGEAWQELAMQSLKTSLQGMLTSQREADRILRDWATHCGWLPAAPQPRAEAGAAAPEELRALQQEMAALREQLRELEARVQQQEKA